MRNFALIALACLGAAACTPTTTGTVVGATTGAVVGGPVGAVVGAGVGAVAAQPGSPVRPGVCVINNEFGEVVRDRRGRPVTRRC